jgi:16S rRNA (adenine1518-N6/adenine1519-N6)-dimethyltransferase
MLREEVIERLRDVGVHPDKKLGQHFLIDDTALATILREADLSTEDTVLEIGAGLGTLTEALCRRAGRVVAYEPDERMCNFLREKLGKRFDNLELREHYINRYELDEIYAQFPDNLKIVSNLPYGITSEVVISAVGRITSLTDVVIMLQHEVVKRLTAHPDNKNYGSLAVYTQTFAYAEELLFVPREAFMPVPNVDSQIARLHALSRQPEIADTRRYFRLVQGAFHHRRKTISNALLRTFPELGRKEILRRLAHSDILPDRRGDTLSRDEFISLSAALG